MTHIFYVEFREKTVRFEIAVFVLISRREEGIDNE